MNKTSNPNFVSLPALDHVGIVVKDIDKTVECLSSNFNIGNWNRAEVTCRKEELVTGEPFKLKIADGQLGPGPVEIHFQESIEPQGIWYDHFKTKGEGLHHIAFKVPNMDEVVAKLKAQGAKFLVGGTAKANIYPTGNRFCCFELTGGIILELNEV